MPDSCSQCLFYILVDSTCHFHAPTPSQAVATARWPKVETTDWCGGGIHKTRGYNYSPSSAAKTPIGL